MRKSKKSDISFSLYICMFLKREIGIQRDREINRHRKKQTERKLKRKLYLQSIVQKKKEIEKAAI